MPSYIKFRDVSAVITAGQHLASAGQALENEVGTITADLSNFEDQVLRGTDNYSRDFLRDYNKEIETEEGPKPVNEVLRTNSWKIAVNAHQLGDNVVQAAKGYLWVDAVNGAAMFRSAQGG
jgi:hypothetical protein